jgi:DNA-binding MarR family transcriptional regulator
VNPGELTWSQTTTLARLDKAGWATTADLARAESVKPQSMGATLTSLEQEGLVQRRPHPTDGRQVLFALTDEGVEARRKRTVAKREWLLAAVAKLDPAEQQTLMSAAALIKRLGDA